MPAVTPCSIVELRQYTLAPGTRDAFIALFEREFVETQEAAGMRLLGTFTDLEDPDRFVWLRGFDDMASRHAGLSGFYFGPCWQAHRDEANAMMLDSDNVRLLHPVAGSARLEDAPRAGRTTVAVQAVGPRVDTTPTDLADLADIVGVLETANVVNDFPRLPVIENEDMLVVVLSGGDRSVADVRSLSCEVADRLGRGCDQPATVLRLAPTPRSRL